MHHAQGYGAPLSGQRFTTPQSIRAACPAPQLRQTLPVLAPTSGKIHFALFFAALLIFNHFGRPFEHVLVGFRLPAAICGLAIIICAFSGGLKYLKTRVGMSLAAIVFWMCASVPFSTWKGGSTKGMIG